MNWFAKRRLRKEIKKQKALQEIANKVKETLSASDSWERFLPPVVVRDKVVLQRPRG